jgi:class 3 adenylate cyclase
VLAASTAGRLQGVELERLGTVTVKGRDEPVEAFTLGHVRSGRPTTTEDSCRPSR